MRSTVRSTVTGMSLEITVESMDISVSTEDSMATKATMATIATM